jgi:hypothetical protein
VKVVPFSSWEAVPDAPPDVRDLSLTELFADVVEPAADVMTLVASNSTLKLPAEQVLALPLRATEELGVQLPASAVAVVAVASNASLASAPEVTVEARGNG